MNIELNYKDFSLTTHSKGVVKVDDETMCAMQLLKAKGFSMLDAALLCSEIIETLDGDTNKKRIRQLICLGEKKMREEEHTVSFSEAVEATLRLKVHRSNRTLQDIRQTMHCLMQDDEHLASRPIRSLNRKDCTRLLDQSFAHSPSRFIKARANLSGIFTVALQQGWCDDNPVKWVPRPLIKEREIEALPLASIKKLFAMAALPEHSACLPALGLMLYAGVRPEELRNVMWDDIDWEEKALYLRAKHTKTGGGRHIPVAKPLMRVLKAYRGSSYICPPQWRRRWRLLRQEAGFDVWTPDVLRHSFASYHAKFYHDLPKLQLLMGHRDCQLLLTRYINLRGISRYDAKQFWEAPFLNFLQQDLIGND